MQPRDWIRFAALGMVALGVYGLVWAGESKSSDQTKRDVNKVKLEWIEYGAALQRAEEEDKHILIDFYTKWCGWCKVMDRRTYTDPTVIQMLKDNFVISKVNAESAKKFEVGDSQMSGRDLARQFGVTSFPMTWFLKPDGTRIANIAGYFPPERFVKALEYVQERQYVKKDE
ncbi:MAG: thioredoxin family protein [Candidatus Krumholzibacteriia bacterium]